MNCVKCGAPLEEGSTSTLCPTCQAIEDAQKTATEAAPVAETPTPEVEAPTPDLGEPEELTTDIPGEAPIATPEEENKL